MPSSADAKRAYYTSLLSGTKNTALADLEVEYFTKATAGTVASSPAATTATAGVVKKSAAIADIPAQTVTDIATAQTAVNVIVAKINAWLAAERTAGQLT